MTYLLIDILSYSVLPAAIVGIYRYRTMTKEYRLFVWYLFAAFVNEVCSTVCNYCIHSNALNSNIFILIEWLVLLGFFRAIGSLQQRILYLTTMCIGVVVWLVEHLVYVNLTTFTHVFRIAYACIFVFIAMFTLGKLAVQQHKSILNNASFIICCGLAIIYAYEAIVEVLYAMPFNTTASQAFELNVFLVPAIINVLCNIIFLIGCICIPTKQKFTLPY